MTRPNMGTIHDVILDLIRILEKMMEDKIREIHNLRKQVHAQQQQCKQQGIQIIELSDKIKLMEEMENVDAAEVIKLDWEDNEISTSQKSENPYHELVPHEQIA